MIELFVKSHGWLGLILTPECDGVFVPSLDNEKRKAIQKCELLKGIP